MKRLDELKLKAEADNQEFQKQQEVEKMKLAKMIEDHNAERVQFKNDMEQESLEMK